LLLNKKILYCEQPSNILSNLTVLKWKLDLIIENTEEELNKIIQNELDSIKAKLYSKIKKLDKIKTEWTELHEKVKWYKLLNGKTDKLKEEEIKLKKVILKEEEINKVTKSIEEKIEYLSEKYSDFYWISNDFRIKILDKQDSFDDIKLDIEIKWKNKDFNNNFIEDTFNLRSLHEDLKDYKIENNSTKLKKQANIFIEWILNNKYTLKTNFIWREKDIISNFLDNYFIINYKIEQDWDSISEMSPWKKSFVLLKLLINLDNSKCPILLDQPEDDLDNRSIYNELVKFIKEKKKERQIIIATHNPNLVVWADAECVIVANQHWENNKNEKCKFDYVQGWLENTFPNNDWIDFVLDKRWIQEHVCDILEWWKTAFEHRKKKYNI
jgi:predicted ATPase